MNWIPYLAVWAVLAVALLVLIVYRRTLAREDDEVVHVLDTEAPLVAHQVQVGRKMELADRWGKILTALVIVYSVVLACVYLYMAWQQGSKVPLMD